MTSTNNTESIDDGKSNNQIMMLENITEPNTKKQKRSSEAFYQLLQDLKNDVFNYDISDKPNFTYTLNDRFVVDRGTPNGKVTVNNFIFNTVSYFPTPSWSCMHKWIQAREGNTLNRTWRRLLTNPHGFIGVGTHECTATQYSPKSLFSTVITALDQQSQMTDLRTINRINAPNVGGQAIIDFITYFPDFMYEQGSIISFLVTLATPIFGAYQPYVNDLSWFFDNVKINELTAVAPIETVWEFGTTLFFFDDMWSALGLNYAVCTFKTFEDLGFPTQFNFATGVHHVYPVFVPSSLDDVATTVFGLSQLASPVLFPFVQGSDEVLSDPGPTYANQYVPFMALHSHRTQTPTITDFNAGYAVILFVFSDQYAFEVSPIGLQLGAGRIVDHDLALGDGVAIFEALTTFVRYPDAIDQLNSCIEAWKFATNLASDDDLEAVYRILCELSTRLPAPVGGKVNDNGGHYQTNIYVQDDNVHPYPGNDYIVPEFTTSYTVNSDLTSSGNVHNWDVLYEAVTTPGLSRCCMIVPIDVTTGTVNIHVDAKYYQSMSFPRFEWKLLHCLIARWFEDNSDRKHFFRGMDPSHFYSRAEVTRSKITIACDYAQQLSYKHGLYDWWVNRHPSGNRMLGSFVDSLFSYPGGGVYLRHNYSLPPVRDAYWLLPTDGAVRFIEQQISVSRENPYRSTIIQEMMRGEIMQRENILTWGLEQINDLEDTPFSVLYTLPDYAKQSREHMKYMLWMSVSQDWKMLQPRQIIDQYRSDCLMNYHSGMITERLAYTFQNVNVTLGVIHNTTGSQDLWFAMAPWPHFPARLRGDSEDMVSKVWISDTFYNKNQKTLTTTTIAIPVTPEYIKFSFYSTLPQVEEDVEDLVF